MIEERYRTTSYWPSSAIRIAAVAILWLISVYLAVRGGENPGFVAPGAREGLPYPWRGVVLTWLHTGLYAVGLYWLLRPRNRPLDAQLGRALGAFALLSLGHLFLYTTDMPGYVYVPAVFALWTTLLLGVSWLVSVVATRHAREHTSSA